MGAQLRLASHRYGWSKPGDPSKRIRLEARAAERFAGADHNRVVDRSQRDHVPRRCIGAVWSETEPGALPMAFDYEGVAKQKVVLVERGGPLVALHLTQPTLSRSIGPAPRRGRRRSRTADAFATLLQQRFKS